MSIVLSQDFRTQVDSIQKNVAIASGAKNVVRRLLKVIDEYDGSGAEISDTGPEGKVVLVDAAPKAKIKEPAA